MDDILTTKEASKYLKVSEEFLRHLIRNKIINAYSEGRRGGYRIPKKEIIKYIDKRLES